MDLRWRTVVVTGAGDGLGREVALRFARAGAGVVATDRDAVAAQRTADLVRARRVGAWSVQTDVTDEGDLQLLAARLHDLGGADVLVVHPGAGTPADHRAATALTRLFVDGLSDRRSPAGSAGRAGDAAVVVVARHPPVLHTDQPVPDHVRITGVVTGVAAGAASDSRVAVTVVDLARRGSPGEVVDLAADTADPPTDPPTDPPAG